MRRACLCVLLAACAGRAPAAAPAAAPASASAPAVAAGSPSSSAGPGSPSSSAGPGSPSSPREGFQDPAGGAPIDSIDSIDSIAEPPIETTDEPVVPAPATSLKQRPIPKGSHAVLHAGNAYPAEALRLGIEGTIRVRMLIDAQGKVRSAVLLDQLGHGLDELARERAHRIEFEPARDLEGRPVASHIVWTFRFVLPPDDVR